MKTVLYERTYQLWWRKGRQANQARESCDFQRRVWICDADQWPPGDYTQNRGPGPTIQTLVKRAMNTQDSLFCFVSIQMKFWIFFCCMEIPWNSQKHMKNA